MTGTMDGSRRGLRVALAVVLVMGLAACDSWGHFRRGPERTGYNSDEKTITLANVDTLEVAWDVELPGDTSVTAGVGRNPVVAGDRVFLPTAEGTLYALDAATGEVDWSAPAPGVTEVAVVSQGVFMSTSDRYVSALDPETGAAIWRRPMSAVQGPPFVFQGTVFTIGTDHVRRAFDAESGRLGSTNPGIDPGGRVAFAMTDHSFYVRTPYDPSAPTLLRGHDRNGGPRWNNVLTASTSATPVLGDGRVYLGGRAFDQWSGDLVWASPSADYFSSPAYADGTVYGQRGFSLGVSALDAATGAVRWQTDIGEAFPAGDVGPAVTPGLVWAVGDHSIHALDSSNGEVVWESDPAVQVSDFDMVTVAGGRVFAFSGDRMVAWELPS